MSANTKVYYQEVSTIAILDFYVKSFKLPDNAALLKWEGNSDPHTGKTWFRLTTEALDLTGPKVLQNGE